MLRALILSQKKYDGVTWYRHLQFANMARKLKLADIQFLDFNIPDDKFIQVLTSCDIFMTRLTPYFEVLEEKFEFFKLKKPVIVDMDDGLENIDPLSDMYRSLGTEEVVLPDGTFLWKNGQSGFDVYENRDRLETFKEMLGRVTAVTTTTFTLKNYIEQYNKNVVIIPNAIEEKNFPVLEKQHKEIRLMWSGGSSHYSDLAEIKPALDRLMFKYPNLHFYILGVAFNGITKDMPQDRVHRMDWVQADGHGFRLACMQADIGICPLRDTPFNRNKSSVKFYELAALNVACVARNIPPYSDDIVDGSTGLLYNNVADFEDKVSELIDNPIQRMAIAENGRRYVKENRSLEEITKDLVLFLEGVSRVSRDNNSKI